jgi:hypothetical protein
MLDETVSVNVAKTTWPDEIAVFSLSQARPIGPSALGGLQEFVVILSVIDAVPVFFT